ncbi:MAG: VOC family protein [Lachnospiraceae bacterium]|nr:VOC family protein [Lachnospiraceae bacterium]
MKFVHVTIQTKAFEEEIAFFEKFAGLAVQRDLRPMGSPIVFLADAEGETNVEIIENREAESIDSEQISIGFHAEDLEETRRKLSESGFAPTPVISPMPQVRFFFVRDPAGVRVQFI